MSNVRRSIQEPINFDQAWFDGERWFRSSPVEPVDVAVLLDSLEYLFPDVMRQDGQN